MASFHFGKGSWFLVFCIVLVLLPGRAAAFGAGNIPSIAQVEGHNWRHGDIEDMLETIAYLNGKKWTSLLISRVYFGNWLRDYSQAVDVGSLKGVNAATIRILVWVLSFLAHGYATEEFEVTEERLGCYRPEEHIDNPLGYAEGLDARTLDPRLRGPVDPVETEIDSRSGMKNYIANERGGWATSAGYLRFSLGRSIHYGRLYTSGAGSSANREEDLCEALRCLGQALHTLEDFPAHSNYCELALRELGYHGVFPHCGTDTEINLRGKRVYPLVTGTFGAVDFLHSVLGEANDHFTQSEVDEMNAALINAQSLTKGEESGSRDRGLFSSSSSKSSGDFISLIGQLPGIGDGFMKEARDLQASSAQQEQDNMRSRSAFNTRDNVNQIPGMSPDFDPVKTAGRIYPILQFRDKIVKAINRFIAKVPGLEKLLERISETLTAFILGLLAPFIQPIIQQVSKVLKEGSSGLIGASAKSQFEPWDNPRCSDPTHSMLSKDHFTNILNSCAGRVASTILQYITPRVLYAWENPGVPVDEVVDDVLRAFHHPVMRDDRCEIQSNMFKTVREWADGHPRRHELSHLLNSQSVKDHKNHILNQQTTSGSRSAVDVHSCGGGLGHGKTKNSLWNQIKTRDLNAMEGEDRRPLASAPVSHGNQEYGYRQDQNQSHIYTGTSGGESAGYYGGGGSGSSERQESRPSYDRPSYDRPSYDRPSYDRPNYDQPPPQQSYGQQGYGGPPPGQYGGPPPGQYGGPPPGQYGGPPPAQYGGPPPGQYGAPQGYGGPPPQQQYGGGYQQPPPPQGYGQPPPPHYGGGGWSQYPGQGRH
ncbi:hypothetical protein VD0002_g1319 [Verticillium dahliae]|uniref:Het-C protein n=2 Tax=Verticillium dahliae TaxID=27337 RepID=G2XAB4_VERDV|nr:Het-C protein [Verticillium dahliae VdLs.17]KAH6702259.1 Het-C protein [Verticillium dahliae]EGY15853.1 Het-C protein [Verticillium dahliae VdLs.17]PNH36337.1 hypothetical protein BJF96_g410 [Verticillium dahliae]PNH50663.1 hypothetical protein VD0003_g6536 [Verticillium dahliae]PNH68843.1 hypothetical protein VD0002_g1319 [Verticillium dahliae]